MPYMDPMGYMSQSFPECLPLGDLGGGGPKQPYVYTYCRRIGSNDDSNVRGSGEHAGNMR